MVINPPLPPGNPKSATKSRRLVGSAVSSEGDYDTDALPDELVSVEDDINAEQPATQSDDIQHWLHPEPAAPSAWSLLLQHATAVYEFVQNVIST
jgi:hypothetical protein